MLMHHTLEMLGIGTEERLADDRQHFAALPPPRAGKVIDFANKTSFSVAVGEQKPAEPEQERNG